MRYPFGILQRWKNVLCRIKTTYPPYTGFPYVMTSYDSQLYMEMQAPDFGQVYLTVRRDGYSGGGSATTIENYLIDIGELFTHTFDLTGDEKTVFKFSYAASTPVYFSINGHTIFDNR